MIPITIGIVVCLCLAPELILKNYKKYCPDIVSVCQKSYDNSVCDLDFIRIDEKQFSNCLDLSIDYALMEHTNEAIVVPMDGDWSDVGSWASLWDITNKDNNGNVLWGRYTY